VFDHNLARRLVVDLADLYAYSQHIHFLGMATASDEAIWLYAQPNGMVIVSKDSDFYYRSMLRGHPPKVVWIRILNTDDLPFVEKFYAENYDTTIFSAWMLEQPFIGLFVDNVLASAGGAAVLDTISGVANIGNFLTLSKFRGRRYAQMVAKALMNELMNRGFSLFTLGTTEENVAAWRAWESIGFRLLERRVELELKAL
jgi:predicted nuclease of predicted toxin-antitoxin system